jgi:hypothetical protein
LRHWQSNLKQVGNAGCGYWRFDDYGVTLRPELAGWKEIPPALLDAYALVNTQKEATLH